MRVPRHGICLYQRQVVEATLAQARGHAVLTQTASGFFLLQERVFGVQIPVLPMGFIGRVAAIRQMVMNFGISPVVFCRILTLTEWAHSKLCSAINAEDERNQNGAGVH